MLMVKNQFAWLIFLHAIYKENEEKNWFVLAAFAFFLETNKECIEFMKMKRALNC